MNDRWIQLGVTAKELEYHQRNPDLFLGRIIAQNKGRYLVATEQSTIGASISGKWAHLAQQASDYPAVGDFVLLDRMSNEGGDGILHQILPRRSAFIRKAAGTSHQQQIVAANIDTVFLCMSLNNDFNLRRLERYVSVAWDSGAMPVVVLTKADLCTDLEEKKQLVAQIAPGVDIVITKGLETDGADDLLAYVKPGKTVAFIGSSGVGKSTLINDLLGGQTIETRQVRKDDKGRHTTTHRELFLMPSGGAVIDTPGMRELGVESIDSDKTFSDIAILAEGCRFSDCEHENEPGCAVTQAIEGGVLDAHRLANYKKLKKEAKYNGLNAKQIEKTKIDDMFKSFGGMKNARDYIKSKKNR
jgi:ribosome biogenesis GTPase